MTVLAWLLLYATVIQLGQSNYSISSEDGAYEVNSYANNKFPFIDRSQIRRTRRSVDSDLEDAKTALGIADETLKKAEGEHQKANTTLSELEGNLTKARKLADERRREYDTAVEAAEIVAENFLKEAVAAVKPAEDAYNEAEKAFNKSMLAWNKEDAERKTAEETYNNTKKDKTTADTKLTTATDLASKMKELKHKYDTEQKKKKEYMDAIQLFDDNQKFVTIIETETRNIKDNQLKEKLENAENDKEQKDKEMLAINSNDILNGNIDEDFGESTVKAVQTTKGSTIFILKEELKAKKDTPEAEQIQKSILKEERVRNAVLNLMELDPENKNKKVVDVKKHFDKEKETLQKAVEAATTAVAKAQEDFDTPNNKLKDAQTELAKVDIKAITTAKDTAKGEMKQVEENIKKYSDDLDTFSTANGGKKGETEWVKLKGILDGDVAAKTTTLNTAKQAVINAQNDYTQKKTAADTKLKSIKENEEKDRDNKKITKDKAVTAKDFAQKEKDGVKDYIKHTQKEHNSAKDRVTKLEGEIEKAKETMKSKKIDVEKARNAENDAKAALKIAQEKKEEEVEKETAHNGAQGFGIGFGAALGIALIGASVGVL